MVSAKDGPEYHWLGERGRWNLWELVSGRGCLHELAAKKLCLCSASLSYLVDQQAMFLG